MLERRTKSKVKKTYLKIRQVIVIPLSMGLTIGVPF